MAWGGRRASRLKAAMLAESDICHLCGRPGANSLDHIIPRSVRPDLAYEPENMAPAHLSCNLRRGTQPVAKYRAKARLAAPPRPQPTKEALW